MKSQLLIFLILFFGLFTTSKKEHTISDNVKTTFGKIDHSYLVSEAGAFIETVPLDLPPGVAGVQPNLAFLYDSRAGVSEMGSGWKLTGISHISRVGKTIANNEEADRIRLNDEDSFVLDGQFLVLTKGTHTKNGATYRTENETFSQILAVGSHPSSKSSPNYFIVRNKNGWKYSYGIHNQSKVIAETDEGNEILTWSLNRVEDQFGNFMEFDYLYDSSSKTNYINKIIYTGNDSLVNGKKAISSPPNEILFLYDNALISRGFLAGQAINKTKILKAIEISNETDGGSFFRKYFLNYNSNGKDFFLKEIFECDGENNCLNPLKISWESTVNDYKISDTLKLSNSKKKPIYGDFNNDGRTDIIVRNSGEEDKKNEIYTVTQKGFEKYNNDYASILDENLIQDDTDFRNADFNGDGYLDILKFHKNKSLSIFYNRGFQDHFHFNKKSFSSSKHPYPDQNNRFFVGNFKGEGKSELIQFNSKGVNKIFELNQLEDNLDSISKSFLKSEKLVNLDKIDHYSGDFDGDGKSEILVYIKSEKKSYLIDFYKNSFRKILFSENLEFANSNNTLVLDINKDGNTDIIQNQLNKKVQIFFSNGNKLINSEIEGVVLNNTDGLKEYIIGNFNGSSSSQFLAYNTTKEYSLYEFNGREFKESKELGVTNLPGLSSRFSLTTAESNDNGISDIIGVKKDALYLIKDNNGITNKVIQIEDGFSNTLKIEYSAISDKDVYENGELEIHSSLDNYILSSGYTVVKNLHYSNGLKGNSSTNKNSYHYSKLLVNKKRGLQGFQSFTITDDAQNKVQIYNYLQEFPLTGKVSRERLYSYDNDGSSTLIFDKSNKWDFQTYQSGRLVKEEKTNFSLATSSIPSAFLNQFKNSILKISPSKNKSLGFDNSVSKSAILLESILQNNPNINIDINLFKERSSVLNYSKQSVLQSIKTFNSQKLTYFPFLKNSISNKFELDGSKISSANILNEYSNYGHPKKLEQVFDDGSKTITRYEYEHLDDKNIWILGLIKKKTSSVIDPSKGKSATNTEEYIYDPNNGLLLSKIREPNNLKLKLTEDLDYDVCGNIIKSTTYGDDNIKRWVEFEYEAKYKRFKTGNRNAKNHLIKSIFDSRTGLLKRIIDPNGIITNYEYDLFGNLNKKTIISDKTIETKFEYFKPKNIISDYINNVEYAIKIYSTGLKPITKYYDNQEREIGAQGKLLVNQYDKKNTFVLSKKEYNSRGNIIKDYSPQYFYISYDNISGNCLRYNDNHLAITNYKYDDNNRLIKTILPDGNAISTIYTSNIKIDINPAGEKRTTNYNSKGGITSVTDHKKNTILYEYNLWGKIEKVWVGSQLTSQTYYDKIGRKILNIDLDNKISYEYNAFGNLIREVNKGKTTDLDYDILGRLVNKKSNIEGITKWFYDGNNTKKGFIGKVNEIIDYNNQITKYEYDVYGKPIKQTKTIDNEKFEEFYTFNDNNKLEKKTTIFSDFQFDLDYKYENGILVEVLNDNESVWKLTSMTAKGQKTSEKYGNDVYTKTTFDNETGLISSIYTAKPLDFSKVNLSNTLALQNPAQCDENSSTIPQFENPLNQFPNGLDPSNPKPFGDPRWTDPGKPNFLISTAKKKSLNNVNSLNNLFPSSLIEDLSNNSIIQSIEYDYNNLYNLTNRKTTTNSHNIGTTVSYESFRYDDYNRISNVTYKSDSNYYVSNYTYDTLGNITYNSNTSNKEGYYKYENDNPYQLTAIKDRYDQKIQTFKYDDYGNIKKISNGTNLDYTSFNKPSKIKSKQGISQHYYDSDNKLILKKVEKNQGQETTYFYPFNDFEVRKSSGKTQILNSIIINGSVVSITLKSSDSNNPKRYYLHKDHLGSSNIITDSSGGIVSINRYDTFGKKISLKNDLLTNLYQGFGGHKELNHEGLIDMGGRIYSSNIGRFLNKDPFVQSPTNFQNYNRYSYVLNNPLNNIDPSGYFLKSLGKLASSAWKNTVGKVYKEIDRGIRKYGKQIVIAAVAVTVTVYTGGAASGLVGAMLSGAAAGAAASATAVLLNGGDFNSMIDAALTGAATGAISAGIFYGVGSAFGSTQAFSGKYFGKIAAHGGAGGIMSEIRGGNFQDGFMGAAVTQAFSPSIGNIDKQNMGINFYRTTAAALVGGTASLASGGDFASGALSASFSRAYNDDSHWRTIQKIASVASAAGTILIPIGNGITSLGAATGNPYLLAAGGLTLAAGYTSAAIGYSLAGANFVNNLGNGNYAQAGTDLLMTVASAVPISRFLPPSSSATATQFFRDANYNAIDLTMTFND